MKLPYKTTFYQLFYEMIVRRGNRVLMTCYEGQRKTSLTGEEYVLLTEKYLEIISEELKKQSPGFAGMRCGNRYDYFAVFFALLCAGYPVVMLDENCDARQLEHFAEQSDMRFLISDRPVESERLKVLLTDELRERAGQCIPRIKIRETLPESWADQMAFVTSGTTGAAKIFAFQAETILLQTWRLVQLWKPFDEKYNRRQSNTILQILPFRHCFGFDLAIGFLQFGYELILPGSIGAMDLIHSIRDNHVWLTSMVPAVMKGLYQVLEIKMKKSGQPLSVSDFLGPEFSTVICAGAKLNEEDARKTCQTGLTLICGWGMTEIGIASFGVLENAGDYRGYTGRLLPWYKASLNQGTGCEESGQGELLIDGDLLYDGMVRSGKTEPRKEKMFSTGDIFRIDENRNLYFVGRSKSVIIGPGGENVYPEEIEEALEPFLDRTLLYCVVGENEVPVLFVDTVRTNGNVDEEELEKRVRAANQEFTREKRIAAVYLMNNSGAMTSKGELSRFRAGEYLKNHRNDIKKIMLRKEFYHAD